ncbi:MAG: zinc ABC transporter substrate-binding protein [Geminicoccaceae bacterium]
MHRGLIGTAAACLFILSASKPMTVHAASAIKVAATVAPVHSLVAMVTEGIAEPALIVRPGASPHGYALKPSEAQALDRADLVFWVGEGLEPWMAKAVTTLASDAAVVELAGVDGLIRLPIREAGVFEEHAHDEPGEHGHDAAFDPHLWLDPDNAVTWLDAITGALEEVDPSHAAAYRANADQAKDKLSAMTTEIEQMLKPIGDKPYVVFHDAYQYFEHRFGLAPIGAISLGEANRPGPATIVGIRDAIAASGAVCIFSEPQFEPKLTQTVIEGSDVKSGVLDPIGAGLQPGAELYRALMMGLAGGLAGCLG